jgi:hypothetical protein
MKTYIGKACRITMLFFLLIFIGVLSGCAGNYGSLSTNNGLLDQYKGQGLPDTYNYYYCGRSSLPYAVVGIDNAYGFKDRIWLKIESKEDVYKKISSLSDLHRDSSRLFTKDILDTEGKKIGVWFSYYQSSPIMLDAETMMVEIPSPYNPNSYGRGD